MIGGTLSGPQQASAACDGPCNVISGADANGIVLSATAAHGVRGTTIAGNHIGVGADGSADLGNTLQGISFQAGGSGGAQGTDIGGIAPGAAGDENLISNNGGAAIGIVGAPIGTTGSAATAGTETGRLFIDLGARAWAT